MVTYTCPHCGKLFDHHGNYLGHLNKKNPCVSMEEGTIYVINSDRYQCLHCDTNCSTKWNIMQHYRRTHKKEIKEQNNFMDKSSSSSSDMEIKQPSQPSIGYDLDKIFLETYYHTINNSSYLTEIEKDQLYTISKESYMENLNQIMSTINDRLCFL